MADEYLINDKAWAAINPLLSKVYAGARRKDDQRIISGIVDVLCSGCRWKDCPAAYDSNHALLAAIFCGCEQEGRPPFRSSPFLFFSFGIWSAKLHMSQTGAAFPWRSVGS